MSVRKDHVGNLILGADQGTPQQRFAHTVYSPVSEMGREEAVRDNPQIRNHPYFRELSSFNGATLFFGALRFFSLHYYDSGVIDFFPSPENLILVNFERGYILEGCSNGMIIGGEQTSSEYVYFVQDEDGSIKEVTKGNTLVREHDGDLRELVQQKIAELDRRLSDNRV